MKEKSKQSIQLQINKLKNLPDLPESSMRILAAINDPDISIDKLAEVLSISPGLVARLLGLANSAYFGQSRKINDLRTAIFQVLGLELVKSLSLGVVLNVHFDTRKCHAFNTEYFWMRSLLTAIAAQKLACHNKLQQFPPSTVYTCGLLLYIGMLVLGYLIPEKLDVILQRSKKNRTSVGEEKPLINLLKLSQHLSSMLLDDKFVDMDELGILGKQLLLSDADLPRIVDELIERRESIQKLASILGS